MIRSDPPLVQLDDSDSVPIPSSLPRDGSAGRATGRPVPKEVVAGLRAALAGPAAARRSVILALGILGEAGKEALPDLVRALKPFFA